MISKYWIILKCVLVAMLGLLLVSPAFAGGIYMYEGNDGKQDLVGALSDQTEENKVFINFKKTTKIQNDEVRSLVLKDIVPNTIIKLFDDPGGSETKDDWVEIKILKKEQKILISSLEENRENNIYRQTFHNRSDNKLDGKVSSIKIIPAKPLSFSIKAPSEPQCSKDLLKNNPQLCIYKEAERIIQNIKTTAYSHVSNVNDEEGNYLLDCSGVLYYILHKSLRLESHYSGMQKLAEEEGHKRPLADTIYNYITSASPKGWSKVKYLQHAKPGDIIVHKYGKGHGGKSTGHVIILAGDPVNKEKVQIDGKDYWEYTILIIDSARSGHYDDTRNSNKYKAFPAIDYIGTNRTGLGKGYIYIGANKNGEIQYERWKGKNRKPDFSGSYAIGRAIPIKE